MSSMLTDSLSLNCFNNDRLVFKNGVVYTKFGVRLEGRESPKTVLTSEDSAKSDDLEAALSNFDTTAVQGTGATVEATKPGLIGAFCGLTIALGTVTVSNFKLKIFNTAQTINNAYASVKAATVVVESLCFDAWSSFKSSLRQLPLKVLEGALAKVGETISKYDAVYPTFDHELNIAQQHFRFSGLYQGVSGQCTVANLIHKSRYVDILKEANPDSNGIGTLDVTTEDQLYAAQLFVARVTSNTRLFNAAIAFGVFGPIDPTVVPELIHPVDLSIVAYHATKCPRSVFADLVKLYVACVFKTAKMRVSDEIRRTGQVLNVVGMVEALMPPSRLLGLMGVALGRKMPVKYTEALTMARFANTGKLSL